MSSDTGVAHRRGIPRRMLGWVTQGWPRPIPAPELTWSPGMGDADGEGGSSRR